MANFQPVSNSTIKTQLAGKFRQRWNTISRLTGQNKWLVEDAKFKLPKLSKTGKQQILIIKCPQHVIDVIHEIYDGDVRWTKWRPEMNGQRHYAQYDSYSGTKQKPPGPNDLYVDTLWPDKEQFPNWSDRDSFVPSLKSKYQVIRFLKSGKTVKEDGTSVSSSDMTKLQETGSAIVFKHVIIGKLANKQINEARDIIKVKEVKDELNALWQSIAHTNCDMEWINNFYKQQKALLKALKKYPGGNDFEEFERDGPFMTFITKKIIGVNNVLGIKGKDNWNPADIWLIKKRSKHIDNLRKIMDTPAAGKSVFRKRHFAAKIEQFNNEMRALFKEKEIWGISLKLVTQAEAKWEFVNVEDKYFTALENKTFSLGTGNYRPVCKLGTEPDTDSKEKGAEKFVTQDSTLWVLDGDKQYKFQVKGNDSTKLSNLKYESTQKGFGAARLGKATAAYVEGLLDAYGDKHAPATWKNFKKSNDDYPSDVVTLAKWKEKILEMAKFLDQKGVDFGEYKVGDGTHKVKPGDVYNRFTGVMANKNQSHVANNKLMQMSWLCCVLSIQDTANDGIREFLTDLVFISKKEGKQYGPFLKLY